MDAVIRDYRSAGLEPRVVALLDWAVKLTVKPSTCSEGDITALRDQGWTDEDISAACMVAGYFNFINRVAEGLGVEGEPYMEDYPKLGPCPWVD